MQSFEVDCYAIQGRRDNMEDSCDYKISPDGKVLVLVADGLGGLSYGEYASSTTIEVLTNTFPQIGQFKSIPEFLRKAIYVAATLLMQKGITDPEFYGTATTLTGFIVDSKQKIFYTVNVGDSRVYLFSDNKLKQLTKDHSLVQELIDSGELTPEEALYHPDRNVVTSVISGDFEHLKIDITGPHKINKGDILLAMSDGVHGYLTNKQIEQIIKENLSSPNLAKTLVEAAYQFGSTDNISVCYYKQLS